MVQGEPGLGAAENPLQVAPVLPDNQAADENTQEQQNPVVIYEPGGEGEGGPGPDGAQGHPAGEHRQHQEAPPHHQGDAPVDHDGDGAAGQDALAPLEVEHAGEHMAQQAEGACPVLAVCHHNGLLVPKAAVPVPRHQDTHPHGHDGLEHIGENDRKGQRAAEGAVKIGQAGIAAAVGAHVIPQDILGHDHGAVEAAAEVGCHRHDHQGQEQIRQHPRRQIRPCHTGHIYPSLSLFCRMVSRIGVPSRPKVARIWFSRYR